MKKTLFVLALFCAAFAAWILLRPGNLAQRRDGLPRETDRVRAPTSESTLGTSAGRSAQSGRPSASTAGPEVPTAPGQSLGTGATTSNSPNRAASGAAVPDLPPAIPPATLLESMRTTIRQYGLMFGGNPVGTNPEITAALNGDNPKQVRFLGPDGNRINEKGELVDAWGTPYFFHQLSAMQMEIRSAGPDKVMWTADDLVIK